MYLAWPAEGVLLHEGCTPRWDSSGRLIARGPRLKMGVCACATYLNLSLSVCPFCLSACLSVCLSMRELSPPADMHTPTF